MSELILNNNNSKMDTVLSICKILLLVTSVLTFDAWYPFSISLLNIDFPKLTTFLTDIKDIAGCLTAVGALVLIILKIKNEFKNK